MSDQLQTTESPAIGQSGSTVLLGAWVPTSERLPPDETPVLLFRKGKKVIGERRWETPTHEESFQPFWYWACCEDWWHDDQGDATVTHWAPMIEDPNVKVSETRHDVTTD
jgi:hypothetical protein